MSLNRGDQGQGKLGRGQHEVGTLENWEKEEESVDKRLGGELP